MLVLNVGLVLFLFIHSLLAVSLPPEVRVRSSHQPHDIEDIFGSAEQIQHMTKRQRLTFGITGVQSGRGGDGSVPLRLEIRQLQQNADQWNLYLLALDRLQKVNQTDQLSYYQIAGIHGRPYVAWDNVQATPGAEQDGYCTHASILFPTWHRPYLALYEQVLYNLMQQIVGEFPAGSVRNRYATAASSFRIPYWDWAAAPPSGQSVLPASVASSTVQVTAPNGTTTIKNPLFSYTFHPLDTNELPDSPFKTWPSTLRYPTSSSDPNATSQNDLVAKQLDNNRLSFRDRLYNLFTAYPNYRNFSNKAWIPGNGGNYDSIESVHDQIHGLVGSGGHMGIIDYSAFDPIFYLHHTNVDRAFAIWQAIYPDSYVQPETTQFGTFTNAAGSTEDVNTALTPFHTDGVGDFWNSGTARNISTFGYSYPELQYWKTSNRSQYQANVRAVVNNLYGSSAPAAIARRISNDENNRQAVKPRIIPAGGFDGPSDPKHSIMVREQAVDPTKQETAGHSTSKDGQYREWIANVRVKKYALNGSFFVHVFLGDFNPNSFQWSFEPNLVGTHCIFVNDPTSTQCGKCKRDQANNLQVTGAVPLTTALLAAIRAGSLVSLDPADVEPYLKTNLHWRVTKMDDTAVPTDQVSDLKVAVVSSVVQKPTSDTDFPHWGDFNVHDNVTDTRPAGLCTGEPM